MPIDAELNIAFNTDQFADDPDYIPDDFRFFKTTAALKTTTISGTSYPNPSTLSVKEIASDGSSITVKYTSLSATIF